MVGGNEKTIDGQRVVYEGLGRGTGDVVYQTNDGRVWETKYSYDSTESSTGVIRSTVKKNEST